MIWKKLQDELTFYGGVFITGSNQDAGSMVHGDVYQKTAQGFKKLWQSGDGSPVEEFILT